MFKKFSKKAFDLLSSDEEPESPALGGPARKVVIVPELNPGIAPEDVTYRNAHGVERYAHNHQRVVAPEEDENSLLKLDGVVDFVGKCRNVEDGPLVLDVAADTVGGGQAWCRRFFVS